MTEVYYAIAFNVWHEIRIIGCYLTEEEAKAAAVKYAQGPAAYAMNKAVYKDAVEVLPAPNGDTLHVIRSPIGTLRPLSGIVCYPDNNKFNWTKTVDELLAFTQEGKQSKVC